MKKKELIKQLNNLQKTITPDQEWKENDRDILFAQIKAQTRLEFVSVSPLVPTTSFFKFIYKPVVSMLLVLFVVSSVWITTVSATKNSLPGDLLYNVKLTTERFQVNLTLNNEKKANLEMEFAQRRLDEIKKVVVASNGKEDLALPLKKFEESMVNVKSSLVKLEQTDKDAALKIADIVEEKTQGYVDLLEDHQETNPELAKNAEQAILASNITADKALSLVIEDYQDHQAELSADQIEKTIYARIDNLNNSLNKAKNRLNEIINKESQEAEQAALALLAQAEEQATIEAEEADVRAQESESENDNEELVATDETSQTDTESNDEGSTEQEADQPEDDQTVTEDDPAETGETEQTETGTEPESAEEIIPSPQEVKDKPAQAYALLEEARQLLINNEINQAFIKVKEANQVLCLINQVINNNIEYLNFVEEEVILDDQAVEVTEDELPTEDNDQETDSEETPANIE